MEKETAKTMTEMLCFHVDAALVLSEHLSDDSGFIALVRKVLEDRSSESLSVEEQALWETVKDLFDRPSQLN